MVLGTAHASRNYLKVLHEITKISVLAGSLWDNTIIPDYEDYQVKNKVVYFEIFKYMR